MKNDERNGERNKKRIFACNRAALIAVFVLSLIVFAGGCTVKSAEEKECASKYCYCQICEEGKWEPVDKTANNIVTQMDCAEYCKNLNKKDKNDEGYAFICSDAVARVNPKCNCNFNERCCRISPFNAKVIKYECEDISIAVCPYGWQPNVLCKK